MIIRANNTFARIVSFEQHELDWLRDYLSFEDKTAFFKTRKLPAWKRKEASLVRMVNDITMTFPSGFVDIVVRAAAKDGITIEVLEDRTKPVEPDPAPLLDWLRDYQLEGVMRARERHRGVFHHVTGAGKTETIIGIAELYSCNWLILTHKIDLLYQIEDRFALRTGEALGRIHGGFAPKRVTLTTFQTIYGLLAKRDKRTLEFLDTIGGIMVDECHIVGSETFYKTVMAMKNAYYRYGFSGTPFARTDKKSIYVWGALGEVIHEVRADTLIKRGVLARPTIRLVQVKHGTDKGKDWATVYQHAVMENEHRNEVVAHVARDLAKKPALVFVKNISHGRTLERMLRADGVKVEFVWGQHDIKVRRAAIQRLVHGDVDVLICNVIFQEGIDIPELQSVIIASGGKSVIMALQDVGRGMRKHDRDGQITKEEFEVYDISDVGCGCQEPKKHKSCRWLEKHSRARIAAYTKEKYRTIQDGDVASIVARRSKKP